MHQKKKKGKEKKEQISKECQQCQTSTTPCDEQCIIEDVPGMP